MGLMMILFAALLLAALLAVFFGCMWLEGEIRRHAVRHDESLAELARRSLTVSAQITGVGKTLEHMEQAADGGKALDLETFEAFQTELWKRLEGGTLDGAAEFEEGVRNSLAFSAGKVPGVEVSL